MTMDFYDWFALAALALFLAAFVGRTLALGARGVRVFVIGAGKRGVRRAVEAAAMVILVLFWALTIGHALRWERLAAVDLPAFTTGAPAHAAGAALVAAGLGFFLGALASFGGSWRIGIDKRKPGSLVTGGVFAVTRNPVFLGMDLSFIGTLLLYPTWAFLALAAVFVVGVHFHIREEERFLLEAYGNAYVSYKSRVARYLV
jgi:protein-S-isoprenylcysteine O-methyltransferase Ste14